MVIGIDASRANTRERTGTEWYSFHVIQELKKIIPADYKVRLYTKEPLQTDLSHLPDNWESRVLRWRPGFLWTQLRLSIEMLLHKPDILYIPAHTIPIIHPNKVALVVHDVGFERQEDLYNDATIGYDSGIAKRLMNALVRIATLGTYGATEMDYHRFSMRLALRAATRIITISEFSRSEIVDVYGFDVHTITVIPNGLNTLEEIQQSAQQKRRLLESVGIAEGESYVLFVGRIEQKKNIPRLIDAFAALRAEHGFCGKLVLVGSPGYQYELVQQKIAEQNLRNYVVETGWVTNEQLQAIMEHATVFVLPSMYEGFGIPILEAMQQNVPVVCSDIPPLREVGADAALYANPKDPSQLATQIAQFTQNPELRQEYIARGLQRVRLFSWKNTAAGTWKAIEEILNQR